MMNEPCKCCIHFFDGKCMMTEKAANMKGCNFWEFDYGFVEKIVEDNQKRIERRKNEMEKIRTEPRPGKRIKPLSWFADAVSRYHVKRVEKVMYGRYYMYMQWDRERVDEYWEFPTKEEMEKYQKEYNKISPDFLRDLPNEFVVAEGKFWDSLPESAKEK